MTEAHICIQCHRTITMDVKWVTVGDADALKPHECVWVCVCVCAEGVATAQSTTLEVPVGSDSMLPINLCSVATSNQGNGARRHAVIRMMKSFACRPMPAAAVGPSDADLLTAAWRPVSTVPISFLLYYGCGCLFSMLPRFKTMTVSDPDHRNVFRSLLHVLFLSARSVYFPSLALNEPLLIKH